MKSFDRFHKWQRKRLLHKGKFQEKGSFSRPPKRYEATIASQSLQIETHVPLLMYNLNVLPPPKMEEPFEASISIESSSFDSNSSVPLELVVEKVVATCSKGKETMTSKKVPSWVPKRGYSKVEILSKYQFYRRSSLIKDRMGDTARELNYVSEIVAFFEEESKKETDSIAPYIATETPQPTARTTRSATKKGK